MANITEVINELKKFSDEILELGTLIHDNRIKEFELEYDLNLPEDFKLFISQINGFSLMGSEVYGFDKTKANSIENIYYREHFKVRIPQYPYLVPFSPDGRGNFYCLDTHSNESENKLSIVFWVSNYEYSTEDPPEIVASNFINWIQKVVIDWTLEDYNYDGSEK